MSIIRAVPRHWIYLLKERDKGDLTTTGWQEIKGLQKTSKWIYDSMIRREIGVNPGRVTWGRELVDELTHEEWSRLMKQVNRITLSTKLRYFQYRLLHKKILKNIRRSKWADIGPNCYFLECSKVNKIWRALERWVNYMFKMQI